MTDRIAKYLASATIGICGCWKGAIFDDDLHVMSATDATSGGIVSVGSTGDGGRRATGPMRAPNREKI